MTTPRQRATCQRCAKVYRVIVGSAPDRCGKCNQLGPVRPMATCKNCGAEYRTYHRGALDECAECSRSRRRREAHEGKPRYTCGGCKGEFRFVKGAVWGACWECRVAGRVSFNVTPGTPEAMPRNYPEARRRSHHGLTPIQEECIDRKAVCEGCPAGGWLTSGKCQVYTTPEVVAALSSGR